MRYASLALIVSATACTRTGIGYVDEEISPCTVHCDDGGPSDGDDIVVATVTVVPAYSTRPAWTDYVRLSDTSKNLASQPSTACDGSETSDVHCFHAGEIRHATLVDVTSCASLTATDDLDAFDWHCDDSQGTVVVYSTLKATRGLRQLVGNDGFLANRLSIQRDGSVIATSESSVWWSNPVVPLPVNVGTGVVTLDQAGTIYVAATSQTTDGYNIGAHNVAIVTRDGATLAYSGATTNNCNSTTAETSSPNYTCLIAAGGQDFLWLEASLDARSAASRYGVLFVGLQQSRVTHTTVRGGLVSGIAFYESSHNLIDDLEVSTVYYPLTLNDSDDNSVRDVRVTSGGIGKVTGVSITDSTNNRFEQLRIANVDNGIYLYGATHNTLVDVVVSNIQESADVENDGIGIQFRGAHDNVLANALVSSVASEALRLTSTSARNTVAHVTVVASTTSGVTYYQAHTNTFVSVASLYSGDEAFFVVSACTDNVFADVLAGEADSGFYLYDATTFRFTGALYAGGFAYNPCYVESGTQPGLITTTCSDSGLDGSSTYTGQLSDAVLHPGRNYDSSLVGPVTSADAVNTSDADGLAVQNSIGDWTHFESPYRAWGRSDAGVPLGPCTSGNSCRIWDWRLSASDDQIRNVNGVFTQSAACPASAHGDVAMTDSIELSYHTGIVAEETSGDGTGDDDGICESGELCHNTFLRSASELIDDDRGDDDGLCESGEACVYAPNIGVYQGHDALTEPCIFTDGAVSGVELRAYLSNGL